MKFVVKGPKILALGRAIQALARVGEVLYISPEADKVVFETVNSSHSAALSFQFHTSFFSEYAAYDRTFMEDTDELSQSLYKCGLIMKSILTVFRSLANIEKIVESCVMFVSPKDCKVKIHFECKYSVTKYHDIRMIETETLTTYDNDIVEENSSSCNAKVLSDAANNFLRSEEEVTMTALPDRFVMRNYTLGKARSESVHTEFTMYPCEFDSFRVTQNSSITYPLKELRAMISFADNLKLQLTTKYGEPGKPICYTVSVPDEMTGRLVMATISSDEDTDQLAAALNTSQMSADSTFRDTEDLRDGDGDRAFNESAVFPSRLPLKRGLSQASTSSRVSQPPLMSTAISDHAPRLSQVADEEMLDLTVAHPDPPAKKARFIFKRCFDSTFNPKNVPGSDLVLAPDSDEEI